MKPNLETQIQLALAKHDEPKTQRRQRESELSQRYRAQIVAEAANTYEDPVSAADAITELSYTQQLGLWGDSKSLYSRTGEALPNDLVDTFAVHHAQHPRNSGPHPLQGMRTGGRMPTEEERNIEPGTPSDVYELDGHPFIVYTPVGGQP